MSGVVKIPKPDLAGKRLSFVLAEDRVGHYSEFRQFFTATFDLEKLGLSEAGYVLAPSGEMYVLVFVGRSGEVFPSGVEIYAVSDALEPLDDSVVDSDLWAILNWTIEGVGGEWTVKDLDATGKLYLIPAVSCK
jgi:hypothetical protein